MEVQKRSLATVEVFVLVLSSNSRGFLNFGSIDLKEVIGIIFTCEKQ